MLDLYQTEAKDILAQAARQPAASLETSPAEAFHAAWEANDRFNGVLSWQRNMADAAQDHIDMFAAKTGERLANPYRMGSDITAALDALHDVRRRMQAKATELNEPGLAFPDENTLYGQGIQKARSALGAQQNLGGGQQAFGTGLAQIAAGAVSQFDDPINGSLNAIAMMAAPGATGVLRGILMTGATFAAQSAAEEALTYGYKSAVLPSHGVGDAAQAVIGSALGGMAFDAGGRALAGAFRKIMFRNPAVADALPQSVRDAAIVAERAADLDAQNPFRGMQGEAAFNETVPAVERALVNGDPVVLPEAAAQAAAARTGSVHAPVTPDVSDLIDRQAYSISPRVFQQVDELDNRIANARADIQRLQEQRGAPDEGGALTNRIAQIEDQLSQITGKRRSSPRAKALRAELENLQAQNEQLVRSNGDASASAVQAARLSLVDLINERAALGPKVRAVREHAAGMLGVNPAEHGVDLDAAPSHSGNRYVAPTSESEKAVDAILPKESPSQRVSKARANYKAASDRLRRAQKNEGWAPEIASEITPLTTAAPRGAPVAPTAQEVATAKRAPVNMADRAFVGSRAVDVRYELAELGDLVASHDRDFRVNPDYPPDLQPRDRSGAASREQVYDMAAKLEPERLGPSPEANSGAPIIGPDNVVESGNGRTLAIRAAYDQGGERASAYRAWLERKGFDTTGFNEPVLIARRTSPMGADERAAFAHAANGSASLRMNAVEQALSDARHIGADIAALLQSGEIRSIANRDFVRALVDRLPPGERGGMMTARGDLSQAGVNRIRAALVARAYGDPEVVARAFDHAEPNIKTIAATLTDAAPDWIRMRDAVSAGEIPAGVDITGDIMTAVRSIMRARDEGRPLGEVMTQGDFFTSDMSQLAARLFFKDGSFKRFLSKADMTENLSTFAREMLKTRGVGENLFGEAPPATGDILTATVRRSDARVVSMLEAARRPENVAKAFDDPKVHEAAEADLRRQIEQGKNRVPMENEDGGASLGFADKELHDLDRQIALADEVRTCSALPGVAAE